MNSKNEILLTVSIAAYNVEQYLKQCVESFCLNNYSQFLEIIIINDGSTDDTLKVATDLQKKYPKIVKIIDKKNGGYGSTINAALKEASGKYFKLLDGDDWFDSDEFNSFVKMLKDREEDLIVTDYYMKYMDNKREIKSVRRNVEGLRDKHRYNIEEMKGIIFTNPSATIKTEVLKKGRTHILEKCFYTDHQFMFFSLINSKSIYYEKRCVYCYRLGREGQSVSLQGILKHMGDNWKVLQEELKYIISNKWNDKTLDVINVYISILAIDVIRYQLLPEYSKEQVERIKKIDLKIKELNPMVYREMTKSRPIKILRLSHYNFYKILRLNEIRKYI